MHVTLAAAQAGRALDHVRVGLAIEEFLANLRRLDTPARRDALALIAPERLQVTAKDFNHTLYYRPGSSGGETSVDSASLGLTQGRIALFVNGQPLTPRQVRQGFWYANAARLQQLFVALFNKI